MEKKFYETPELEVVNMEIEGAILGASEDLTEDREFE